jgi:hypothetical protein
MYDTATGEPTLQCHTHTQPTLNGGLSQAVLDRTLISTSLAPRLARCDIDDRTKLWKGPCVAASFHKLINTKLEWEGLWVCSGESALRDGMLMGSRLPDGINTSKMDDQNKPLISKEAEHWLRTDKIQNQIKGLDGMEGDTDRRMNDLTSLQ